MNFRIGICDEDWDIFFHDTKIRRKDSFLKDLPDKLDKENISVVFNHLNMMTLCPGNPDFQDLIKRKFDSQETCFKDQAGKEIKAIIQHPNIINQGNMSTIRAVDCDTNIQTQKKTCPGCSKYRQTLNKIRATNNARDSKQIGNVPNDSTNNRYMNKTQLTTKCEEQARTIKSLKQTVNRKNAFILEMINDEGCVVQDEQLSDLCTKLINDVACPFPDDSAQSLLWHQQKQYATAKNKRTMRWHPVMIRWCISIYLKSPGAYEHLCDSGFLFLPTRRTLNNYLSFTEAKVGFNADVFKHLLTLTEKQKSTHVGLAHDEMKIKSGLVYNKHTGRIIGFTDLGGS
ncbi:uncharacterized protein [Clytia hemisphaerica]|uniref:uncharacterized protein n=1 Tax=Clytia hemisphaerica TaxID=252671 RepID=UPI0034D752D0